MISVIVLKTVQFWFYNAIITVEPPQMVTSQQRPPPYYSQFLLSPKCCFTIYLTSPQHLPPYSSHCYTTPLVAVVERFHCNVSKRYWWMANNEGPDQTATWGAVWSGSALFAQTCLPQYLENYVVVRKFFNFVTLIKAKFRPVQEMVLGKLSSQV